MSDLTDSQATLKAAYEYIEALRTVATLGLEVPMPELPSSRCSMEEDFFYMLTQISSDPHVGEQADLVRRLMSGTHPNILYSVLTTTRNRLLFELGVEVKMKPLQRVLQ